MVVGVTVDVVMGMLTHSPNLCHSLHQTSTVQTTSTSWARDLKATFTLGLNWEQGPQREH